ncbi:MAG: PEP-CTERM sorting domain-containing protein [Phycisphaeraceae bacterium]
MFRFSSLPTVLALALATTSAHALPLVEVDIAPFVQGGVIKINSHDDAGGVLVDTSGNARVFLYDLRGEGDDSVPPFLFLDDPGINSEAIPAPGFTPGSNVGIQVLSSLKFWDGNGPVNFQEVTNGEAIELTVFGFGRNVATAALTDFDPFFIFDVDANGTFAHNHIESILQDESSALSGLYLIELRVVQGTRDNQSGLADGTIDPLVTPSHSLFVLYNMASGLDEDELQVLAEAVLASLDQGTGGPGNGAIPEPASALLLLAGMTALARRRRA